MSTQDPDAMKKLRGSFDVILSTISDGIDFDAILKLLKAHGVLVNVGLPSTRPPSTWGADRAGPGSRRVEHRRHRRDPGHARLLRGARPAPDHRGDPADQINEAYENVIASKVRYRYVIDASTI
nr:hypothetical protein [Tessaracoccus coleopterorum]